MTDDGAREIAEAIRYLARAITDSAAPGRDAQDGRVGCLTEAVMGVTSALTQIGAMVSDLTENVGRISDTMPAGNEP